MEERLYDDIQKMLYYMIPEKWEKIVLYASVNNTNIPGQQGEMFFYYVPKSIFENQPVNCYEIPSLFDIDDKEYLELIYAIYNKIKILKNKYFERTGKNPSNLTISIKNDTFKIEYFYEDLNNSRFDSYERHIIWRARYLGITPIKKEEKEVLEKYLDYAKVRQTPKEVYVIQAIPKPKKNIIDYEKVLTVDEAIMQSSGEEVDIFSKKKKDD